MDRGPPVPRLSSVSSGGPDLFVVCKSCGSEVSPYITECPYCGQRLRKRAPKIERDEIGDAKEPKAPRSARRRVPPAPPSLPKVPRPKRGRREPSGTGVFHGDEFRRPTATLTLVALSAIGAIVLAVLGRTDTALIGPPDGEWWRVASTVFLYGNGWYQFAAVLAIGLFGWRLEAAPRPCPRRRPVRGLRGGRDGDRRGGGVLPDRVGRHRRGAGSARRLRGPGAAGASAQRR